MSYNNTYKEKRSRAILALFFILFFVIVYNCSGQNVASKPMKFSCGTKDTIYIYIASDSLYLNPRLYVQCSKHQHKTWTGITIGFEDGDMLEIPADKCYSIVDISKLKTTKFDYISFDEQFSSVACVSIKTKDYFIKYFNQ